MRFTKRLAAEAIRRHFWQPEPPGPLGGRPWTMGRELQIFDRLARDTHPLVLVGALGHVRAITGTRGPIRMTWLIHPDRGAALLSRAVAAHHASQPIASIAAPPGGPTRGGGLDRLTVQLPPHNRQPEMEVSHDD